MYKCPSCDWETCPYAKEVDGEILCSLANPAEDCDDYFYFTENKD